MNAPFKLYGAELSPYSVKVRAYLRFKGLEFEWLPRSNARQEEFARYAKLPLVPVLVDAQDVAMQDSTPIIEALERAYPEPSITPEDGRLAFVSALLEDYADEWLNKAMFHYRWSFEADRDSAAKRILDMLFEGAEAPEGLEETIAQRMSGRLHHVGSSPETGPVIEASFARVLELLEAQLDGRPFLFGRRPALADFGLGAQLSQLLSDPTPGAIIRAQAPRVTQWLARMEAPKAEGGFESFEALTPGLKALLAQEVAYAYLPWMAANAEAVREDALNVHAEIGGTAFIQKPQRYAAKALGELRHKYATVSDDEALAGLLEETGCAAFFSAPQPEDGDDGDDSDGGEDGEA